MAQLISKPPATSSQAIPLTNYTLIDGLSSALMTGSGGILITATLTLYNGYAGSVLFGFKIMVDGQYLPDSYTSGTLAQGEVRRITIPVWVKPGSGQHTIALYGYSTQSGLAISGDAAALIIHEPGY